MSTRFTKEWLANRLAKQGVEREGPAQDPAQNPTQSNADVAAGKTYNFIVWGECQPAGSKQAFVPLHPKTKEPYRNKNGGIVVSVVDDNKRGKDWKRLVAKTAREECGMPLLTGPLRLTLIVYRERPKSHFATVGLNKQGRETPFPITKPDSGKLARGTIDALTGILYKDDAQIVEDLTYKRYGTPPRVEITIEELLMLEPYEQPELFQVEDERRPWERS